MIRFNFGKKLKGVNGDFELKISGEIEDGERIGIFGPSGSGKSTILRILAGLEKIDWGEVWCDGEVWNRSHFLLAPQKRNIGFVFQDYALFPHLSVIDNIRYGKGVLKEDVARLLEMMELDKIAHHKITQLSGGQAQRVAIARALARRPKILILDEPMSALDQRIKSKLLDELDGWQRELGFMMVLVSHQIAEIYRLSDRVLEIDEGKILSIKTPKDRFVRGNIALSVEVLDMKKMDLNVRLEVLLHGEIFSFVCHPSEVENIKIGDQIQIMLKSFSPLIVSHC
ncbi:sulfate/molybdate ABC transporter ATP-binding protein [Helicobacter pametensis]|uniref:sulfate/molybdate ABC transporter ATP-binding protein n=1 Tax=Helicobacter pametensis TaxID=95149 RepID=UPI000488B36B|nr:ABC transporter ATP-binding protein [Helicobacter pametensis]